MIALASDIIASLTKKDRAVLLPQESTARSSVRPIVPEVRPHYRNELWPRVDTLRVR